MVGNAWSSSLKAALVGIALVSSLLVLTATGEAGTVAQGNRPGPNVWAESLLADPPAAASAIPTPTPIVHITMSDSPDPVLLGGEIEYTMRVKNMCSGGLDGIWLEAAIPSGATFVEATNGATPEGGKVVWNIGHLNGGASFSAVLTVRTLATAGDSVTNRAAVTHPCRCVPLGDAICAPSSQTVSERTTVQTLTLLPTPTRTPICQADEAGNSFDAASSIQPGPSSRSGRICPAADEDWYKFAARAYSTIEVDLHDMAAEFDLSLSSPRGPVVATSSHAFPSEEHLSYRVLSDAGDWRVRVFPRAGTSATGDYQLQVQVYAPTPTPTQTRTPIVTPTPTMVSTPVLELQTWLDSDILLAGELATYTIRLKNVGRAPAQDVHVQDWIPQHTTYVSSYPTGTYVSAAAAVYWPTLDQLGPNAYELYHLTLRLSELVQGGLTLTNTAWAWADGVARVEDQWPQAVAGAELSTGSMLYTPQITAGMDAEMGFVVHNNGPGIAHSVVVSAGLDAELSYVSSLDGTYDAAMHTVVWELGHLRANEDQVPTLTVHIPVSMPIGSDLYVRWEAACLEHRPEPDYERLHVETWAPHVSLTWTSSDDVVGLGERFDLTAYVQQPDPQTVHNMVLSFQVPDFMAIEGYPGYCTRQVGHIGWLEIICPLAGTMGTYTATLHLVAGAPYSSIEQVVYIAVAGDELSPITEIAPLPLATDITIDGLEITQSIQRYPDNNVYLLQNRNTVIRVYATANPPVDNVRCRLRVYRGSQLIGTLMPETDYRPVSWTVDRGDATHNFFFRMPASWAYGTLSFEPEINWDRSLRETDYANNVGERVTREFLTSSADSLAWMRGEYTDPVTGIVMSPTIYALDDDIAYMRAAFPFSQVDSLGFATPMTMSLDQLDVEVGDLALTALDSLAALHDACSGDAVCDARWALVVPEIVGFGCRGIAMPEGRDFVVTADASIEYESSTTAHESGHNFGLGHADACVGSAIDPSIPPTLEDYGLNPDTLKIYPPGATFDIMGYCEPRWPTIHTYTYIYAHSIGVQGAPRADVASPQAGLLVAGWLDPQVDTGVIRRAELRDRPGGPFEGAGSGPYHLELRDSSGNLLFARAFTPSLAISDNGVLVYHTFKETLPPQPGMASLVLKHGTKTLDTRTISANAPIVSLLVPNGGEVITGTVQASWTASDADGDPLTFALQISRDGGQGWLPVAIDLTGTTYSLHAAHLPGSSQARLRVIANDGVRTGMDTSDADFTVPNHPPEIRITKPQEGERARTDSLLFFSSEAWDREDRAIGSQVLWQSDRDGVLGVGREVATRTLSVGPHMITAIVTDTGHLTASAGVHITITPPIPSPAECTEWLRNGDFEQPGWGGWAHGGSPAPLIVPSGETTSSHALLLGRPSGDDTPGLSWVRHTIALPTDTVRASLSFRYRVDSPDKGDYDYFLAAITGGEDDPVEILRMHGGQSRWMTVTADLSPYEGQTIGLLFAVRNDGQGGQTWAYVDAVSLCVSAAQPEQVDLDGCTPSLTLPDYAPSGLPDFDQRQSLWVVSGTQQWSHDGPVALADLLWWRDSMQEASGSPPSTITDTYPLVEAYGAWDDHASQNVAPLVREMARRLDTNDEHPGTDLDNLVVGLDGYLADKGLADDYSLALRRTPSFDWVREEVRQNRQVLLLLGFWEMQPAGWKRLGGHYVAVANASCGQEEWIALSDPFRDAAEVGLSGRVIPPGSHDHPADPPDTLHNNAAYVSHDLYGIMRTAGGWGPQCYARRYADIANFAGLNFAPSQEGDRASAYLHGDIVTLVDYALVLAPRSQTVSLRLSPTASYVRAGEQFQMDIELHTADQQADHVQAFVNFDPTVLRVVDAAGDPASQIISGAVLTTVLTNSVNNTLGYVNFVAEGEPQDGRILVGTIRFQAISTTTGSRITFNIGVTRTSDVLLAGESVLASARDAQVAIAPGGRIVGHAAMQGRPTPPDASWQVPLMVTLSRAREQGAAYVFSAMSSPTGTFAIPGVVAPGAYRLRVKGLHTLRNVLLDATITPGINGIDMETLLEGDAVNDNRVDGRDVSTLVAAFGKQQGQQGFAPRADFNEDDTVNASDVTLLRANLGRRGDVLVGVGAASLRLNAGDLILDEGLLATGSVALSLAPSATQTMQGQVITLNVVAAAGSQQVDAVQVYLDYDPTALAVVDASGHFTTSITAGTGLPAVFLNQVDPSRGYVDFMASSLGGAPASGTFTVATLRLRVLKAGTSWIRFSLDAWRGTNATYQGESVLGDLQAAQVRAAARPGIFLPVILSGK